MFVATSFAAVAKPMPFPLNSVMVMIEITEMQEMSGRCCCMDNDLVLVDIIRGPLAKEDIIAFLHLKRVDCRLRPSLEIIKNIGIYYNSVKLLILLINTYLRYFSLLTYDQRDEVFCYSDVC